ncbi:MAG: integrase family protein [Betaproteobacteria bacterium]|nr:integrase family protein [Betaproteobacteria bacterium]MDE2122593.1 integrase family protein [Betaproteobacteria bacterium]MDE2187192.1 integrase family protein [Betaproteobacteria bacterium]MDE2324053.1 integrase family protein [Betaproteobacteria bacterium]
MSREKFTTERVSRYSCPSDTHQAFFWDTEAPGLGLRVMPSGVKAYIFEGRLHGKTLRVKIGEPGTWSVHSARDKAREIRLQVDQGIDPREVKAQLQQDHEQRQTEARRTAVTVGDAWTAYMAAPHPNWGERSRFDHVKIAQRGGERRKRAPGLTEPGPLASLLDLRLADLDAECLQAWLQAEAAVRPTRTALAFRLLRAFLRWCAESPEFAGALPERGYQTRIVRDAVPRTQAKEGDVLQREQLPIWFEAVGRLSNPITSAYLQTLLLSGARREEWANLQWDDVDFQWKQIRIRDKVEGERQIPLTPYVAQLLLALPRRNAWVFSSEQSASGRLAEPRIAHVRALAAAGLPHLTLHGLRRSFGTLSEWVEVPVGVVAQIMGHKPSAIAEKHYRRRSIDLLRGWHEKLETWILEQAGISRPQRVRRSRRV